MGISVNEDELSVSQENEKDGYSLKRGDVGGGGASWLTTCDTTGAAVPIGSA
jgi:hypothetical protein